MLKAREPVYQLEDRMELKQLYHRLEKENILIRSSGVRDVNVGGIQNDSRNLAEGELFVAFQGTRTDGHRYIPDARQKGASAIVCDDPEAFREDSDIPYFLVEDARKSEGLLADEFYGHPSRNMKIIGVTGTNGKTTTATIVHYLFNHLAGECGLVGTIQHEFGDRVIPSSITTPSGARLHSLLDQMKGSGCSAVALEVSSHGLDQDRLAGVDLDAAIFTGLTRDHLDYHGDMESYADAKSNLFDYLVPGGVGIINGEDDWADFMADRCNRSLVTVGRGEQNSFDVTGKVIDSTLSGTRWSITDGTETPSDVSWRLTGRHNVINGLCAAAALRSLVNCSLSEVADSLSYMPPVKGRLQPVESEEDFYVFVDYAHTPDALRNVLDSLHPITPGRIRAVFGCGGDRDRGKRPKMGKAVEERADDLYVTSDNPRTEDPTAIIDDILEGLSEPEKAHVEVQREKAIRQSIRDAEEGDVVVILGRGHETVQKIDGVERPFEDWKVARQFLQTPDSQEVNHG